MFKRTLIAAALAAALPAHAQSELDALRAELATLKNAYEARIAALEARLARAESKADAALPAPAAPTPQAAPARGGFNPEVSLILQGRYAHLKDRDHREITGFIPADHGHGHGGHGHGGLERGFSADGSELVLAASIDPYFRGQLNAVLHGDEIDVEEAWVQTTALGQGLAVKAGRFRSGLGYQNDMHPHAWDFATNNLVYAALFGEGYTPEGVQLKWVAPTATFLELGTEANWGESFPATRNGKNSPQAYTLFGRVGGDVGASHSWRAGLSWLTARADHRHFDAHDVNDIDVHADFSGKSRTWLADFVWKWAPDGNPTQQNFKFVTEFFQRREAGELECETATPGSVCTGGFDAPFSSRQRGLYAQAVYQFMPAWRVGYRYDHLWRGKVRFDGMDAADTFETFARHDPRRHSLMLDYSPSEFSRVRLQYTRDEAQLGTRENQFFVQYIMSLGSHGAHRF